MFVWRSCRLTASMALVSGSTVPGISYQVTKALFLDKCTLFSGDRGSFLALSAAEHAGGPPVHHGASAGPDRLRGAWSGRSKSQNLASNGGLLSDQLEPTRPMQPTPPKIVFHLSAAVLKYHSSCQRLGSHGTTAALQAFPFVTATIGASACGFVSVRVCACVIVGSYSSRNQGQSQA